jgi:hypothetical protein
MTTKKISVRAASALLTLTITFTLALAFTLPSTALAAAAGGAMRQAVEYRFNVVVENNVRFKMRDGVLLVADVYRPRAEGRFPVLLQRTPYSRKGDAPMALELAAHGYVVVLQDVRGRFDSGGEFYPFLHEGRDGYDTVEWAAALPYADGKVGMFGGSYVGATQMLAAMERPPHLVAVFPYVTASDYYEGWTYQGGALMQWFASSWASGLAVDTLRRKTSARSRPKEWVTHLPLEGYKLLDPAPVADLAPYYRDWLKHERSDEYWRRWKVSDHYDKMTVKGLHAGGWNDLFVKGSIRNYTGLREGAAGAEARAGQRLIVGPWGHTSTSPEGKVGDVVFGKAGAALDMTGTALRWFDYALKGKSNEFATAPPVSIFVMGENVWRAEREFPLARTRYTKYFLHSAKGANGVGGDGRLDTLSPTDERPDRFTYDPLNPVPTIGGRLCCGDAIPPGPFDQRPNESRPDVLVYSTSPLERDVEVTGYVTVELYASTTARDTDFTAMLVDVGPDGYARYLTDGIIRARFRESTDSPRPVNPGSVYKYTIDLWATSNLFKAGHRIRLYVSSSNFPRFGRNHNTGEPAAGATRTLSAGQTVFHDSTRPSNITLPIIPR